MNVDRDVATNMLHNSCVRTLLYEQVAEKDLESFNEKNFINTVTFIKMYCTQT